MVSAEMSSEKMLSERRVDAFLDELASNSPAPGGGSVAALCGALGAALVAMVCRLTVDRPKYAQVSDELRSILAEADQLRRTFSQLMERDTEAFNALMAAFRLSKESDEEKKARSVAIQKATWGATEIPSLVHALSARLLELVQIVAQKGNLNSISDAGVAAEMARAAAQGAAMNVRINLSGLNDPGLVHNIQEKLAITESNIGKLYKSVIKLVEEKMH